MSLLYPEFLYLLILLALFAFLRLHEARTPNLPIHPKLILNRRRPLLLRLAPFLALAWMIAALARPVTVQERNEEVPGLSTLYLAIDASRSMRAVDKKPDRFTFAKRSIERLVQKDKRHKFGLLAFTTNALILSPPTEDARLIKAALNAFNPRFILTHGTSLKALLAYVGQLGGEPREVVIFSDGGDDEEMGELLGIARQYNIRVYAVACATKEGSRVPTDEGWLRDENGRLIISALNPRLERLAAETDGAFIDKESPEAAAEALMRSVERVTAARESERVRYREFFWVPLGLGIGFFLAGSLSMGAFRRLLAPLLLVFGAAQADGGWLDMWHLRSGYEAYKRGDYNASIAHFKAVSPPLLESTYALASTYYRLGAYKQSARLYAQCQSDNRAVKQRIWYNLGNCALKLGHYKSAREYYIKALRLGEDADALSNLKLVLFLEEKERKPLQPESGDKSKARFSVNGSHESKKTAKSKSAQNQARGGNAQGGAKSTRVAKQKEALPGASRFELGSKAYELINKGYVHETRPW